MNRRHYIVCLAAAVLLSACARTLDYNYTSATLAGSGRNLYTIREGESLYAISWRYDLDYKEVAHWNDIEEPYTIYPGQQIWLNPPSTAVARVEPPEPSPALLPPSRPTPPPSPARTSPLPPTERARVTPITPRSDFPPPVPEPSAPIPSLAEEGWQWPLPGAVIGAFSPDGSKKGIDIGGYPGEPIQAASGGKVVYSGGGLVGYGQLIIIKHDESFLSAYAHNRKLLVKEGEQVSAGQTIAELGSTGAMQPMLHFEIREDGQPVDPLQYLPPR